MTPISPAAGMPPATRVRLSAMMFLEYAALGATAPILSLYLRQHLGFTGSQTGAVIAMSALATCASPLLTALAADRLMSAERLLALCQRSRRRGTQASALDRRHAP